MLFFLSSHRVSSVLAVLTVAVPLATANAYQPEVTSGRYAVAPLPPQTTQAAAVEAYQTSFNTPVHHAQRAVAPLPPQIGQANGDMFRAAYQPVPRAEELEDLDVDEESNGAVGNYRGYREYEDPYEDDPGKTGVLNRLLWGDCFTQRTGFYVGGWLEQGITGNGANPVDRFNGPVEYNYRANDYQMNQFYLFMEKEVERDRFSVGGRVDMIYGTDAIYYQSLGLDDDIVSDAASRFYKMAIPQMFVEFNLPVGNGLRAKFGHWYGLVGYEEGLAPYDFFYSHTIGFDPTPYTHTGVLFSYDLTDQLSTSHGLHRGSDVWEDNNNELGYVGNIAWHNCEETAFLYFALEFGPEQDERAVWSNINANPGESLDRLMYSVSAELHLTDRLTYIVNHDYFNQQGSPANGTEDAEAYGIAQYLLYEISDCVTVGARVEVYRDDDGVAAYNFVADNPTAPSTYTNLTLGMNIKQGKCITWRPEIRWDWQSLDNPGDTPAFDGGTSTQQFLFGTDVVIVF